MCIRDRSQETPAGAQVYFGIREHAQAASLVGMAQHGGVLPVSGTFLVFADYMRPSIRLAAMSKSKCVFVFSHDSVGVGEDGPTHQPIEQLMSLRTIPGLQVIRPADANETVAAWAQALSFDGPTALILSRQGLEVLGNGSQKVQDGVYEVLPASDPDVILLATGSEVGLCLEAAEVMNASEISARVISAPNWQQLSSDTDKRDSLMAGEAPVLSVEAGVTLGWHRFSDAAIGIDRFGMSGPGDEVMAELGLNVANVVSAAKALLEAS